MQNSPILARILRAIFITTVICAPLGPAKGATEKYWVNLILTRGAGVTDEVWTGAWEEFKTAFLPSFQSQLPGNARFHVLVGNQHANFYLVNATTTNFNATYRSFRAIPGMLPVIPELSVSVDGPYRGGPPPLTGFSFSGKGINSSRNSLVHRLREGQTKSFACKARNNADVPSRCSYSMSGTAFKSSYGRISVFDAKGRNVTAKLKIGRTIYSPSLTSHNLTGLGRVVITSQKDSDLLIKIRSNPPISEPGHPIQLSSKQTMCRVGIDVR